MFNRLIWSDSSEEWFIHKSDTASCQTCHIDQCASSVGPYSSHTEHWDSSVSAFTPPLCFKMSSFLPTLAHQAQKWNSAYAYEDPVDGVCFLDGDVWDTSNRQRDRSRLPFPTVNTWIDQLFYTGASQPELVWARDTVWERAWLISRGLKFFFTTSEWVT